MMGPGRGPGMGPGFGMGMGLMSAWPGSREPVTGAPYSGVETMTFKRILADGNEISRHDETKVYRDGQGRVRMERTGTNRQGQTRTIVTIFDPVAGYSYMLNPATKVAHRMQLPPAGEPAPASGMGPRRGEVKTQDLGTQTVNGLPATGTRTTETIPAGAIGNQQPIPVVRETWISTALKVPVQIKSSDPRAGKGTMDLTGVKTGEPDAALFQVPSDYTVRDHPGRGPGRMGARMQQRFHRP